MAIFKTTDLAAWLNNNGKPVLASTLQPIWGEDIAARDAQELLYRHFGWETGEIMYRKLSAEVTQCIPYITGAEKALYTAGYNAAIHFGETHTAAHQAGLKQVAKIGKLRKLAQSGQIINA